MFECPSSQGRVSCYWAIEIECQVTEWPRSCSEWPRRWGQASSGWVAKVELRVAKLSKCWGRAPSGRGTEVELRVVESSSSRLELPRRMLKIQRVEISFLRKFLKTDSPPLPQCFEILVDRLFPRIQWQSWFSLRIGGHGELNGTRVLSQEFCREERGEF